MIRQVWMGNFISTEWSECPNQLSCEDMTGFPTAECPNKGTCFHQWKEAGHERLPYSYSSTDNYLMVHSFRNHRSFKELVFAGFFWPCRLPYCYEQRDGYNLLVVVSQALDSVLGGFFPPEPLPRHGGDLQSVEYWDDSPLVGLQLPYYRSRTDLDDDEDDDEK